MYLERGFYMEEYNIDYLFNEVASKTIKRYREEKKMSLEEVVKKMKNPISRQSLFKYENNLARMKNNIFVDICQALSIDPNEIFTEINRKTFDATIQNKELPKPFSFPIIDKEGFVSYGQLGFLDKSKHPEYNYNEMDELNKKHLKFDEKNTFDEVELLFDKHKDILTQDDKDYIKFIIEKRKKEIDKELGEE